MHCYTLKKLIVYFNTDISGGEEELFRDGTIL